MPQPEKEDADPKDEFESIDELEDDDVRVRHHGEDAPTANEVEDPADDHEEEEDEEQE